MNENHHLTAIVDFLNALLKAQPELARVFDCGIPANDAVEELSQIRVRPTVDGGYVTMTGVVSAIGRIIGDKAGLEICTQWDIDDDRHDLIGFAVQKTQPQNC